MTRVAISKIVVDESIYPRSSVSEFEVRRLLAALATGATFPPLLIEAKTMRLVDGRLRLEAYRANKTKTAEVVEKVYASEADLFADAVRANIAHGLALDQYQIRSAIIRLERYGYQRDQISEVVRLPVEAIEKIERGFAQTQQGEPIALKGGLSHLRGQTLDDEQIEVNRHYGGPKAVFYVRQIIALLEQDMWPVKSVMFVSEMDRLTALWREIIAQPRERRSQDSEARTQSSA